MLYNDPNAHLSDCNISLATDNLLFLFFKKGKVAEKVTFFA
jgi:hypothetical protein